MTHLSNIILSENVLATYGPSSRISRALARLNNLAYAMQAGTHIRTRPLLYCSLPSFERKAVLKKKINDEDIVEGFVQLSSFGKGGACISSK